ncbi:hypothetical protein CIT292_11143 [Citrobacter youngae ATCC 29220]|uniref:Uncharacterized protein n=1 Tax=Citrobacter youngae ATCC 29220 TaxID=500640 RepID=D4BKR3_9ENTR|nr:hypothetical protein CIT292_11143 [Citrobacter youngae ATCC 29220]
MPDGAALIRPTRSAYRCRPDKALSRIRRRMCLMALRLSGLQKIIHRVICELLS